MFRNCLLSASYTLTTALCCSSPVPYGTCRRFLPCCGIFNKGSSCPAMYVIDSRGIPACLFEIMFKIKAYFFYLVGLHFPPHFLDSGYSKKKKNSSGGKT